MAGLSAAHRLTCEGHVADVYERWPGIGGQVATIDVGGGIVLERYYHHLFTSDTAIRALYDEVGLADGIEWLPSSVAVFRDGTSHPFTTPLDLLRFGPLSIRSRVRMGWAVFHLQRQTDRAPFERLTAHRWICDSIGEEAWEKLWGPLLRGKFGDRAEEISMAWLWRRLTVRRQIKGREARRELLGYPRGSWQPLLDRLRERIEARGSRVLVDRPARSLGYRDGVFEVEPAAPRSFSRGHDPAGFDRGGEPQRYDAVIATVPNRIFRGLLRSELRGGLAPGYLERLDAIEYHAALCALLELDRPFTPYYWTNIADPGIPFVGLIEQDNLVAPEAVNGRHFLYVANYLPPGDPLLELSHDGLVDAYLPGLRRVNPAFDRSWILDRWTFHEPDAQPVVTLGYADRIPPLRTGVKGLILANTTQVYPEDRGTNYSVALGERAARELLTG